MNLLIEYAEIGAKLYASVGYDGYAGDISVLPNTYFRYNDEVVLWGNNEEPDSVGTYCQDIYHGRSQPKSIFVGEEYTMLIVDGSSGYGNDHYFFENKFKIN